MKKKILQINIVCGVGSTGRIATDLAHAINKEDYEMYIAYGYGHSDEKNTIKIGTKFEYLIHNVMSRITGKQGCFSYFATKRFLRKVDKIKPDLIHLHNIHGNYINYRILFKYIKEHKIPVIWTLHDVWPFTGKCAYFDYVQCSKWQKQCMNCEALSEYPKSLIDNSKTQYKMKQRFFTSVEKMNIVTPSKWLGDLISKSFLNKYTVNVINNGIDLEKFSVTNCDEFRREYKIQDKFVVLGVASEWSKRKGLDFFIKLSNDLSNDYQIVLVGIDKENKKKLNNKIISIEKTNSIESLAEIYSSADVFVNPTMEDNFPTTNIEALACGTPVITFETGGSPEMLDNKTGIIVEKGNYNKLKDAIKNIKDNNLRREDCISQSKKYSKENMLNEYKKLYQKVLEENK